MLWLCLWSVCLCSSIECEEWEAWMAWIEVVGGIYSLQPLTSRWLTLLSMDTPDSPVVHRTWHCSVSGECHVSLPLGFGAVDCWSLMSSCGTGQSGAFWLCRLALTSDGQTVLQSTVGEVDRCSIGSPDSLVPHRTVWWILAEWLWENSREASSRGASAWAPDSVRCTQDSVRCATGCTISCMLQTL
jgi:hypothetical protein